MVIVYGKEQCPECVKVKNYLDSRGISYHYVDVSKDENAFQFLISHKFKSVPQVFKDGSHIGNFQKTVEFFEKG